MGNLNTEFFSSIAAIATAVFIIVQLWRLSRAKLYYDYTNRRKFHDEDSKATNNTYIQTITIMNMSFIKSVEDIDVIIYGNIENYRLVPTPPHTKYALTTGETTINIKSIESRKSIIIIVSGNDPLADSMYNIEVYSKNAKPKRIDRDLKPDYPLWLIISIFIFSFMGIYFLISLFINLLECIFKI